MSLVRIAITAIVVCMPVCGHNQNMQAVFTMILCVGHMYAGLRG